MNSANTFILQSIQTQYEVENTLNFPTLLKKSFKYKNISNWLIPLPSSQKQKQDNSITNDTGMQVLNLILLLEKMVHTNASFPSYLNKCIIMNAQKIFIPGLRTYIFTNIIQLKKERKSYLPESPKDAHEFPFHCHHLMYYNLMVHMLMLCYFVFWS